MVKDWVVLSALALLFWGFWAFLPKLALQTIDQQSVLILQTIGTVIGSLVVLVSIRFRPQWHPKGALYALLTGLTGIVGFLFYLTALRKGKAPVVITMTSLYPVLSLLLAFLVLKEPVSKTQIAGFVLAVAAIVLFSIG